MVFVQAANIQFVKYTTDRSRDGESFAELAAQSWPRYSNANQTTNFSIGKPIIVVLGDQSAPSSEPADSLFKLGAVGVLAFPRTE